MKYCPSCRSKKNLGPGYVKLEGFDGVVLCTNTYHDTKASKEKDEEIGRYFTTGSYTNTKTTSVGSSTSIPRCYHGHQPFPVGKGVLFGGSASSPRDGYDVYLSLSEMGEMIEGHYPWNGTAVIQFKFPIPDMGIPSDLVAFKQMAVWLAQQLREGKKIHIGCMGGHGRTGTVMAAVLAELGHQDPIAYVRKYHCSKAVESESQVQLLVKTYGVPAHRGYKTFLNSINPPKDNKQLALIPRPTEQRTDTKVDTTAGDHVVEPMAGSRRSMWYG